MPRSAPGSVSNASTSASTSAATSASTSAATAAATVAASALPPKQRLTAAQVLANIPTTTTLNPTITITPPTPTAVPPPHPHPPTRAPTPTGAAPSRGIPSSNSQSHNVTSSSSSQPHHYTATSLSECILTSTWATSTSTHAAHSHNNRIPTSRPLTTSISTNSLSTQKLQTPRTSLPTSTSTMSLAALREHEKLATISALITTTHIAKTAVPLPLPSSTSTSTSTSAQTSRTATPAPSSKAQPSPSPTSSTSSKSSTTSHHHYDHGSHTSTQQQQQLAEQHVAAPNETTALVKTPTTQSTYTRGTQVYGGTQVEDSDADSGVEDSIILKDGRRFPTAAREKHVNLFQLITVIYFCVCSGPFGLEEAVRASSPWWVMVLLLTLPWLSSLPVGLLTSELASAMPQNGGYILWVSRAFGNFWGFQEGWWSWTSSLVDTSIYALLFVAYAENLIRSLTSYTLSFPIVYGSRVGMCLLVMITNIMGIQITGMASIILAFASIAPFLALGIWGIPSISLSSVFAFTPVLQPDWGLTLATVLWCLSGWDAPGTVAGDVHKPRKTYPRGVFLAIILVSLTNLFPVMVGVSVDQNYPHWRAMNAYWAILANIVGGPILQYLTIIASLILTLSLLNVLLQSSSWSLFALALPGLLDAPILTRLQYHFRTPWVCIVINWIGISLCCLHTFAGLVQIAMALHSCGLFLECLALVWLRVAEPDMKRPYRIPLRTIPLAIFMLPQMLITICLILSITRFAHIVFGVVTCTGAILYFGARVLVQLQQIDGVRAPLVDLEEVFEDVGEAVEGAEVDDVFPDMGIRTAVQVEALPDAILGSPSLPPRALSEGQLDSLSPLSTTHHSTTGTIPEDHPIHFLSSYHDHSATVPTHVRHLHHHHHHHHHHTPIQIDIYKTKQEHDTDKEKDKDKEMEKTNITHHHDQPPTNDNTTT